MKIGMGYDIHRLGEGRQMVLGGVNIPYPKGPEGHSDGDVLLHAVCDAILGALGKGDIGMRFPDTDPGYKDISSRELLRDVVRLMHNEGFGVHNLDCVVIAEEPKIGPYREKMIRVISDVLKVRGDTVNIKGKTAEKLDVIGEGRAVAAYAVVLLEEG
ncbi:MAG: 2-C-methyl-D-erythritol 2,4-cyclodiphosphate synthase [Candidatus Makaraimicrobium thalassicum]|nr:MAG: 2-C-methyl-D-erythritol 2,4-cyclodiphosphate synthase [Candidatus Omnitrophota bacterium]